MNKTENKLERQGARERKRTKGREGAGARARERQRREFLSCSQPQDSSNNIRTHIQVH